MRQYFADVLLNHPWFDPELSSLVLEQGGEVVGFLGRMARPMLFAGRPVRCAVAMQLMVDPNRKQGFAAIELIRALQAGPQDLGFNDGANQNAVRLWERCGGQFSRLLSFEWTRRLRPVQSFSLSLRNHAGLRGASRVGHGLAGLVDAVAVNALPRLFHRPAHGLSCSAASAREIVPVMGQVAGSLALSPIYTPQTFAWLLAKVAEAQQFGVLRSMTVRDDQGQPVGYFIYFVRAGQIAHVLQVAATYGHGVAVLGTLFRDAWEQGAIAVCGQLDPSLMIDLSNSYCQFRCPSLGVLVHSRNPDILNAIQRGDVFLSRLEGEWWLRLGIDRHADW